MNIFITGVNYKTASVEVRERFSFTTEEQRSALKHLIKNPKIYECVILSTCNRTEVYMHANFDDSEWEAVERLLCELKGLNIDEYRKYFNSYKGVKAVRHLFRVACGIDSMVLGEDQILRQVREAQELAAAEGTSSSVLNSLFRHAVTAAKKVKTNTNISRKPVSVGSLAVKTVTDIWGNNLQDKCAVVIGAGKIGTIVLKNLISQNIKKIYVTTRSHGKMIDMSVCGNVLTPVHYDDRYTAIKEADVVISSTTSPHYTITKDMLEHCGLTEKKRIYIDLAVPRDIDASIKDLDGVTYLNMDDLKLVADKNANSRMSEVTKAEELVESYICDYRRWYEFRDVLPVIKEIQRCTEDIVGNKINETISRLKHASDEDKEIVRESMKNSVKGILNKVLFSIREYDRKEELQCYLKYVEDIMKSELQ